MTFTPTFYLPGIKIFARVTPTMRNKALVYTTLLLFLAVPAVFASELCPGEPAKIAAEGSPIRKLQRGFLNIALCPIDISTECQKEQTRETFPPSWFSAFGRGSLYAGGRALTGVYEMLTFFIPYPANYEPVLYPEFPWQKFPPATQPKKK